MTLIAGRRHLRHAAQPDQAPAGLGGRQAAAGHSPRPACCPSRGFPAGGGPVAAHSSGFRCPGGGAQRQDGRRRRQRGEGSAASDGGGALLLAAGHGTLSLLMTTCHSCCAPTHLNPANRPVGGVLSKWRRRRRGHRSGDRPGAGAGSCGRRRRCGAGGRTERQAVCGPPVTPGLLLTGGLRCFTPHSARGLHRQQMHPARAAQQPAAMSCRR